MSWYSDRRYVPVAERRARGSKKIAKLRKSGRDIKPIEIEGRTIAKTFWGKAWCENLEAYSDYANRLPRGRTYARNGSILDLQIERGQIDALVNGTSLYKITLRISPLPDAQWAAIRKSCAGQIDSLVEMLRGELSNGVMEVVTRAGTGLFPSPKEIDLSCSCPDWAVMCKHVAATLYGVGARLDHEPEMLFSLRGVDPAEMVEEAIDHGMAQRRQGRGRVLAAGNLSSVFGVDIDFSDEVPPSPTKPLRKPKTTTRKAKAAAVVAGKPCRADQVLAMMTDEPDCARHRSQSESVSHSPPSRRSSHSSSSAASSPSSEPPATVVTTQPKNPELSASESAFSESRSERPPSRHRGWATKIDILRRPQVSIVQTRPDQTS